MEKQTKLIFIVIIDELIYAKPVQKYLQNFKFS